MTVTFLNEIFYARSKYDVEYAKDSGRTKCTVLGMRGTVSQWVLDADYSSGLSRVVPSGHRGR